MIAFRYILQQCGLSQNEAATFLEVTPNQITAWCGTGTDVPWHILDMLANLYEQIRETANDTADTLTEELLSYGYEDIENMPDEFDGFSELPCKGAKLACVAMTLLLASRPLPDRWKDDKK